MNIKDMAEYGSAAIRANAISDPPDGTHEARELARLLLRALDEAHRGDGPELVSVLTRPDDLTPSELPGNLGNSLGGALPLSLARDRRIEAVVSDRRGSPPSTDADPT